MIESWLKEIEENYRIEILFASETGSRVWGGATKQSDYDIRFIYKHRDIRSYLSLRKAQETIDFPAPYDAQGWDIYKAFHLMQKSNPGLCEWVFSPVLYRDCQHFSVRLRKYIKDNYSLVSLFYHYIHLMDRNVKDICHKALTERKQKQFIQAVRAFLLAKVIVTEQKVPLDALYSDFSSSFPEDDTIVTFYQQLLAAKVKGELFPASDVRTVLVRIEQEKQGLLDESHRLPKGKLIEKELNRWIWELLRV
ncbi:nucleotidyltransferase domain-containing protein [Bacillus tuaregi]|uniref:nucleotidyltransferase domain-containing protein n=1 Tax=Bacillus tuaregi TaxID=1816695 RepID=UPI0013565342|nr:nucleotidyltransferase domain-containing protein [Bacillus tuaregi]